SVSKYFFRSRRSTSIWPTANVVSSTYGAARRARALASRSWARAGPVRVSPTSSTAKRRGMRGPPGGKDGVAVRGRRDLALVISSSPGDPAVNQKGLPAYSCPLFGGGGTRVRCQARLGRPRPCAALAPTRVHFRESGNE